MSEYHTPVLLNESISALVSDTSGIYVDATFGGGGHTAELLTRLTPAGRVIAFDRDLDAFGNKIDDSRLKLIHNNFRFIHNCLLYEGIKETDGILADLGVSSHQFDTAERGFSFRYDAPLDMRMNRDGGRTAADVIRESSDEYLGKIFRMYGEVPNAGKLAGLISEARSKKDILTTGDLDKAITPAVPKFSAHKYLAKVYQALRIEVNQEMRSLEKFLSGAEESLKPGGRLVIITYQSLEDRMVKNFMKTGNIEGHMVKDFYGNIMAPMNVISRKPVLPPEEEIAANTRARSAKLRIAEKKVKND
ncbi:MAG: 16S rRNA (cytosine(1402)-N(4))-methyltransferase RsmH [Bacteroidales bacterium]|jgi:16S rRNA (cytosine1402-N4)-methyltransferase|nr:16S rRNA (cytosine(1402)-N(4))-methyltransferase RsmH [Bacteroidales bacterium]